MCDVVAQKFRGLGIKKDATRHTDLKLVLLPWWTQKIELD